MHTFGEAMPVDVSLKSWEPVIGQTAHGLGEYLRSSRQLRSDAALNQVREDALHILRNLYPFNERRDGTRTGLAIGYVQSGKTMSMTMVSALARDNGCRIIIFLAGVTTNLLQQNAERLRKDLREASGSAADWRILTSEQGFGSQAVTDLTRAAETWRDRDEANDAKTHLYMVLKNHTHLRKLAELLRQADLRGIPALILDDEADQASLNTAPNADVASTTYRQIAAIREALPHHTYLQYTATPQAPLLIALDDCLSPAFAELIRPGEGYTGGKTFFGEGHGAQLVRLIPESDLFDRRKDDESPQEAPPESLLEAMRVFFLGAAIALHRRKSLPISMLIHPSEQKADHRRFTVWVTHVVERWSTGLRSRDEGEYLDTLAEFRDAYSDLCRTVPDAPSFEELARPLKRAVVEVAQSEVNSDGIDQIDWDNAEVHILIGGQKLNRGYTVKGLTVTYMPRGAGEWNADTIQQRARFFGYKQDYLGLCRIYLHPDVMTAFRSYVIHEEDIRKQLAAHRGRPLREWRRAFLLDADLRPTRRNVLSEETYRVLRKQDWFLQRRPHLDDALLRQNIALVDQLEAKLSFQRDPEHFFGHSIAIVSLAELLQGLLSLYHVQGGDFPAWLGFLLLLRDALESDPSLSVLVVRMDDGRPRERGLDPDGTVKQLHQGRSSSKREGRYPGDAQMAEANFVTLQIHRLLREGSTPVPALALRLPAALRADDVFIKQQ